MNGPCSVVLTDTVSVGLDGIFTIKIVSDGPDSDGLVSYVYIRKYV